MDYVVAGGAERAAVDIASRLGPDVRSIFVSSRLTPEDRAAPKYRGAIDELESAGVAFIAGRRTSTAKVWEWRRVVGELRPAGIDVLHTHSWGSNFWGPLIARASGIPVHVAHEQTPFAREGGMRAWGRQIVVNRLVTGPFSDAVIVPSNWSKRALIEHEGVKASKIDVIPNGAPRRQSEARERDLVRAELGLPPDAPVAIVAAMLRPEKAQQLLIEAAAQLMDRWPSLEVVIAGGGPTGDPEGTGPQLAALSQELGIASRVHLLGHRTDVADLVAASDVAVLSSDHENLPLAVLEYMETGTPIVATGVGGVPELIEHGVHGLLVPARDQDAMAAAIAEILENPEAASRRAEAARIRRRSEFDWDSIARRVRALFERLLAQREPA